MALLSRVLTASCRRYPSRTSLAAALDNLYGSCIESNQERQGDLQIITFSAEGLMHWTDGSSPFRETCNLLFDALIDPLLDEENLFDRETVESEQQNLIMELDARENDRAKYSFDRCLSIFCGDQPQGLSPSGDMQSLKSITRDDLTQAYKSLLTDCSASLFIGGSITDQHVEDCLSGLRRLPETERPIIKPAEMPSPFDPAPASVKLEKKAVEQARIALAYKGLPPYFSHRSIVVTFLNSMLGGDVHSLLFDVVREKLGLAYSVFSMHLRSLSALFVLAGVSPGQVGPALEAIRIQIEKLAAGDFDASLFVRARQMIESSILSVNDDLSTMMAHQIFGRLYGRIMNREESLAAMQSVTPGDVAALAACLVPVTCYVLSGAETDPDLTGFGLLECGQEINEGES